MQWAQTRFGSFRADIVERLAAYEDKERALLQFHALETLRLDAVAKRLALRSEREKIQLRVKLAQMLDDLKSQQDETIKTMDPGAIMTLISGRPSLSVNT